MPVTESRWSALGNFVHIGAHLFQYAFSHEFAEGQLLLPSGSLIQQLILRVQLVFKIMLYLQKNCFNAFLKFVFVV